MQAQTEDYILRLYGFDVPVYFNEQDAANLSNLQDAQTQIEAINRRTKMSNQIIEQYQKNKQAEISTIETSVVSLETNLAYVNAKIRDTYTTASATDLIALNKQRRVYATQAEEALEKLSAYVYMPSSPELIDLADIQDQIANLQELKAQQDGKIYYEVGEVDNCPWVLKNNERWVTSKMGYRENPMKKDGSIGFHSGTDYRAYTGTEAMALFDGVVSAVGYDYSGGNYVKVYVTENIYYIYFHLSEQLVQAGDIVHQGDVIALTGNTGASTTGPHLHLGLYINKTPVDVDKLFTDK